MDKQRLLFLAILLVVTISIASSVLANTSSHARVVSLSLIRGTVIARTVGSPKWARADLNMPIQQGVSIATARQSLAEVQFENGSTVRLGELSRIDFMQMGSAPRNNEHFNNLNLAFGFATINVIPKRHDEYVLTTSIAALMPDGKTEFRTDLSHGHLRVEVFNGRVRAVHYHQSVQLKRNYVLTCDYGLSRLFQVTDTIQMDKWDTWVETRNREAAYSSPGPGKYEWENDLIPFGGVGALPGTFAGDVF